MKKKPMTPYRLNWRRDRSVKDWGVGSDTSVPGTVPVERYEWPTVPLPGHWWWWRGSGVVGERPGVFCWRGLVDALGMPVPDAASLVWVTEHRKGRQVLDSAEFRPGHDRFELVAGLAAPIVAPVGGDGNVWLDIIETLSLDDPLRLLAEQRLSYGFNKYGQVLKYDDGRPKYLDQLQEAADGWVYAVKDDDLENAEAFKTILRRLVERLENQ